MLIGITGTPCAGKSLVEAYLVETHGFKRIEECFPECLGEGGRWNSQLLLEEITPEWQTNYVIGAVERLDSLEKIRKRPFFLLIAVDAPLYDRYQRYKKRLDELITAESFMKYQDDIMYRGYDGKNHQNCLPVHDCMEQGDLLVMNHYDDLKIFHLHLESLNLVNPERMRPSWDTYFMLLAELAARRSNCMKRRVGAMLVKHQTIISTGYNGTPRNTRNCNNGGCFRCNSNVTEGQYLDQCLCLHAEENALLEAGRERAQGSILYCNTCPCLGCAKKIIQAGIIEVVYAASYHMDDKAKNLFKEAGILVRQQFTITTRSLSALRCSEG